MSSTRSLLAMEIEKADLRLQLVNLHDRCFGVEVKLQELEREMEFIRDQEAEALDYEI